MAHRRSTAAKSSQVTKLPLDVDAFALSPDGQTILFASDVFVDCDTLECTAEAPGGAEQEEEHRRRSTSSLLFRHWDTWKDGRRAHLFAQKLSGGPVVNLQKKQDADCPTKPFGGTEDFTISPDGKTVVYVARDAGREEAWSTDLDLFSVPLDGKQGAGEADGEPTAPPTARPCSHPTARAGLRWR